MRFLDNIETFFPNSLIVEFSRVFGKDNTQKLLSVFGGMVIKIPSSKDIHRMEKEVAIFKILSSAKDGKQLSILRGEVQAKFGMKKKDIIDIHKRMSKAWKSHMSEKAKDKAVSKHKRVK